MCKYIRIYIHIFFVAQHPPVGQCFLIFEASRSHSGTPHSAGFLWTRVRLVTEASTFAADRQPCTPAEFEPVIPASKRPQTYALERAATGMGYI